MLFPSMSNFINESLLLSENFFENNDALLASNYNFLFYLSDYSNFNTLKFFNDSSLYTKSLILFINQGDDLDLYKNLENITSIYHYSIPNVKLCYPEPFIASPSFMHTDL